ncbi:MAG: hypothetical protein V9E94_14795 [Microthrixaceae bacterium]
MLLNLSGAHGPFFTRNLVVADRQRRPHRRRRGARRREDPRRRSRTPGRCVVGRRIGDCARGAATRCGAAFADRDAGGRGRQTFDLRVADPRGDRARVRRCSTSWASTSACRWRRCWARASSATRCETLGYLFYVGDRRRTDAAVPRASPMRTTTGCGCGTSRR